MKIQTTSIKNLLAEASKALVGLIPFIYEQLKRKKKDDRRKIIH